MTTTNITSILCGNLQTRNPDFDHFEVVCYDSATRQTLIAGPASAPGTYDATKKIWTQTELISFDGLTMGVVYSFRARVVNTAGGASPWSEWINETAGDDTPPATTFTGAATKCGGGLYITATPTGSPSDHDHYEWYHQLNNPTAPVATTTPTLKYDNSLRLQVTMLQSDACYVWIRDVDTSGNREAWQQLSPSGGTYFTLPSQPCTNLTMSQSAIATSTTAPNSKTAQARISYTVTTPSDPTIGFLHFWSLNYKNSGKYELQYTQKQPTIGGVNTGSFDLDLDYRSGTSDVAHTVTFYCVSATTADVFDTTLTNSVSYVFPSPGINGVYSGPQPPGALTAEVQTVGSTSANGGGCTVALFWSEETDLNIDHYNIYRAAAGTHGSPTSPSRPPGIYSSVKQDSKLSTSGSPIQVYYDRQFAVTDLDPTNPARFAYWITSVSNQGVESSATASNIVELSLVAPGEIDPSTFTLGVGFNMIFNSAALVDSAHTLGTGDLLMNAYIYLSAINNNGSGGVRITTTAAHGFSTSDTVIIRALTPTYSAYLGQWVITVIDSTHFDLNGATIGGSTGAAKGVVQRQTNGQPITDCPAYCLPVGYSRSTASVPVPVFKRPSTVGTGEVNLPAYTTASSGGASDFLIYTNLVSGGGVSLYENLCVTAYLKNSSSGAGTLRVGASYTIDGVSFTNDLLSLSASVLTTTYTQYGYVFPVLDNLYSYGYVMIEIYIQPTGNSQGIGDIYIYRPMLNVGRFPAAWTNVQDPSWPPGSQNTDSSGSTTSTPAPTPAPYGGGSGSGSTGLRIGRSGSVPYV